MKKYGKVVCPKCGATIDVNSADKYVAHKAGNVRCVMSGKRVQETRRDSDARDV